MTFCHGLKLEAPDGYIKDMRRRDPELGKGWGQIAIPLVVETDGGLEQERQGKESSGVELSTLCVQLKIKVAVKRDEQYGNDEDSHFQRQANKEDPLQKRVVFLDWRRCGGTDRYAE